MVSSDERDHKIELRRAFEQRLRKLELQAAAQGASTPAHIQTEIDQVRLDIKQLTLQINENEPSDPTIDRNEYMDISAIGEIERRIGDLRKKLAENREKKTQANESAKSSIDAEIQNIKKEGKRLYIKKALLLTVKLQNHSNNLFKLISDGKYKKTKQLIDGIEGIYATLDILRSAVNWLIGNEDSSYHWKDRNGGIIISFVLGVIVAAICTTWAISVFYSQGQDILKPIQKYSFETGIPKIFSIAENAAKPTLGDFGFEGKHSLKLNLSQLSSDESNRGVVELVLTDTIRIEAISTAIFIPEDKTSRPVYAQLEAVLENDVMIHSISTQLRPGFWTPMFWGTRSTFGDTTNIKILRLLIHCPDTPYNGLVYVDDLSIYDLVPEKSVNPTVTPSPANKT